MHVAFGLKSHSGWAALVAVGVHDGSIALLERSRIALVEDRDDEWAGQPYHAADGKPTAQARAIVAQGIEQARRCAIGELRAAQQRMRDAGHDVVGCAVLAPAPMPAWSVEEILAVHLRMHKAEGVMYPDALLHGARENRMTVQQLAEKQLRETAVAELGLTDGALAMRLAALGKSAGAPWGADQKAASLAALIALRRVGAQVSA